jgi:hypothetical protein
VDAALDRAEARTPAAPAASRKAAPLQVSDEQIVAALQQAAEPLSASELRVVLAIPSEASYVQVTRILRGAVERGAVTRTGERRATRCSAP